MRLKGGCGHLRGRPESQTGRASQCRQEQQERQEVHDRIDAELHTVGLRHFGAVIAQRMELIELLAGRFNHDSRWIRRMCLTVLDRIASIVEPRLQSSWMWTAGGDMSIAAYLHDIGKSGPFGAPAATQEAIVTLYAVENVPDPGQTIAETVRINFSSTDAESILESLGSCACVRTTPCARSGIAMVTDARHSRSRLRGHTGAGEGDRREPSHGQGHRPV
jgi:hypothetical protein